MTLAGAIGNLADKAALLSNVRGAPDYPPEAANAFPFVATYPDSGRLELVSAGWGRMFHTINMDIHVNRSNLPTAVETATPLIEELVRLIIGDPSLGGNVAEVNAIRYNFLPMSYAEVDTLGYRVGIDVKILEQST